MSNEVTNTTVFALLAEQLRPKIEVKAIAAYVKRSGRMPVDTRLKDIVNKAQAAVKAAVERSHDLKHPPNEAKLKVLDAIHQAIERELNEEFPAATK